MYKYLINGQEVAKEDFEKSVLNSRIIEASDDLSLTFIRALIQAESTVAVQNEVIHLVANFETVRLFSTKNPIKIAGVEYGILTVQDESKAETQPEVAA